MDVVTLATLRVCCSIASCILALSCSRILLNSSAENIHKYGKTPSISTYVFSGLATVQVLIFGGRTYFRGGGGGG